MVKLLRYAGFWASAVWAQLASGVGLAALAVALVMGWRRMRVAWLLTPAAGFAAVSLYWFDTVTSQSKVGHALTNSAFEFLVMLTICVVGYLAGRLARRLM